MKSTAFTTALISVALAFSASIPATALAAEAGVACEQLASRSARTASEHAMLADYFRQKAAERRKQASRGGAIHLGSKNPSAAGLRAQAEARSRRERMIADEYDRMAAEHDAQATAGS